MTQSNVPWTQRILENDNKYFVTRRVSGVADGDSSELVVENTGDDDLFVEGVVFKNNQGKALVDVTQDVTIDSAGTSVDVESVRVNAEQGGEDFSAEFGGTYSGGDTFDLDLVTGATGSGGGPSRTRVSTSTTQSPFLLDSGRSIRFTLSNESGASSDQLIRLICYQPQRQ